MNRTIADQFHNDPRVIEAKRTLVEILTEYQNKIVTPKAADPALQTDYDRLIVEFSELRAGKLFYPYLASGIGKGCLVELADGSVKYDFINGIGVHHFGHSHPLLVGAALDAALGDTTMQGNLQQGVVSAEFARTVLQAANAKGAKLAHCFITATGVMGGENALKIAFQKNHPAERILAFEGCFMGRTLALSRFTDKPSFREGLQLNYAVDYVPFFDPARPKESRDEAARVLKNHIKRYPKQHAAMCFELVQGEGGFNAGDRDFFLALMDTLKEHGIAVLIDEVQTFARTDEMFAFQHFGLSAYADVVWLGKASQACATLFTADYKPRGGLLSQTFTASTSAISCGLALIREMLSGGYFGPDGKIARLHAHGVRKLRDLAERHKGLVAGPFGLGAMIAFTPFGGDPDKVNRFIHKLYDNGVIAFTAGTHPMRARFLLPVGAVTEDDIDKVMDIVENTLVVL